MSRYRKTEVRLWSDEKFRSLSPIQPSGQSLWIYLLAGPFTTSVPGLFRAGRAAMAEDLGWELEDFDRCMEELTSREMAKVDFKARLIWLPNALRHNLPENPNIIRGWRDHLAALPECALRTEAMEAMRIVIQEDLGAASAQALAEAYGEAPPSPSTNPSGKAKPKASGKSSPKELANPQPDSQPNPLPNRSVDGSAKPLANRLPKQEQKQEQEQKQKEKQEPGVVQKAEQPLSGKPDVPGTPSPPKPVLVEPAEPEVELTVDERETVDRWVAQGQQGKAPDAMRRAKARAELIVIKRVFAYYLEKFERNPLTYTLTNRRRDKGRSRLQEALKMAEGDWLNGETYLLAAIDELHLSDWHMGRDPKTHGKRFVEWDDHLFSSAEQLQKWIRLAEERAGKWEKLHA